MHRVNVPSSTAGPGFMPIAVKGAALARSHRRSRQGSSTSLTVQPQSLRRSSLSLRKVPHSPNEPTARISQPLPKRGPGESEGREVCQEKPSTREPACTWSSSRSATTTCRS